MTYRKPTQQELRRRLTVEQYQCTQEGATERPFSNAYWNHEEAGLYLDVVSGEPLFSSLDKYDSGSGWPSFTKPLEPQALTQHKDLTLAMPRTEIRSRFADSHLGHVFDDGPQPTGQRYCTNSAALRFVPLHQLQREGLGRYLFLFQKSRNWELATLAGGCFWGLEELMRVLPGVQETQVGYTGGEGDFPVYEQVKTGKTGHAEALQILFDPKILSFEELLLQFFKMHDPTTLNRQGNDLGSQYRSVIFYEDEAQKEAGLRIKERVQKSGQWARPVVTEIVPAKKFWRAEESHQKYLEKNPGGYTCHWIRPLEF